MTRWIRSVALLAGIFFGCGHSGTRTANSDTRIVPSASSGVPRKPDAAASAASTTAATSAGAAPAPAPSGSSPAPATEEKLPSGLVIRQSIVGGPAPGPELPKGSTILHIGDSFAGALGTEMNKVLEQAGVHSVLRYETSTYIPTWAYEKKLGQYLSKYKPDLVLISLGANELQTPEPEKRIPLIHRLVERLGNRSCVWVAPVLWEGASSQLLDVIRANAAPCVYLDSNAFIVHMPRARDKIHPSMEARPDWARVIARWLAYHRRPTQEHPWAVFAEPALSP